MGIASFARSTLARVRQPGRTVEVPSYDKDGYLEIEGPPILTEADRLSGDRPAVTLKGGLLGAESIAALGLPPGFVLRESALKIEGSLYIVDRNGRMIFGVNEEILDTSNGNTTEGAGGGQLIATVSTNGGHGGIHVIPPDNPDYDWEAAEADPEYNVPWWLGHGKEHAFYVRDHEGQRGWIAGLHGRHQIAPTQDDHALVIWAGFKGQEADARTHTTVEVRTTPDIYGNGSELLFSIEPNTGDVEIGKGGVIMASEDGTRWRCRPKNDGTGWDMEAAPAQPAAPGWV